ncbi:DUF3592 domain-containing protein [Dactylosporangium sp. NPDC005572]|uniref:DUF3592 domain-containing protein n=1 Tax=Dactylosporangium sp. NPDC005572 TaxID=3156889 RepID=UPI0033A0C75A
MRRSPSILGPTASLVVLTVGSVFLAVALLVSAWQSVDDLRGGTVSAEVVDILWNDSGSRNYTVRFTTGAGVACESRINSGSNPPPRAIQVGGQSQVRHRRSDPCSAVRETSEPAPWFGTAVSAVLFVGWLFAARSAWRRRRAATASA